MIVIALKSTITISFKKRGVKMFTHYISVLTTELKNILQIFEKVLKWSFIAMIVGVVVGFGDSFLLKLLEIGVTFFSKFHTLLLYLKYTKKLAAMEWKRSLKMHCMIKRVSISSLFL